ncbi:hypothetical protein M0C34_00480 [Agarivorans sp. TSD2052]|uniref:hypothetical protein n=1 Tax=Agarivorans sp. TSD2052 TaxID=2937286 RepID=UPI00200FA07B|nr:hypothetical protein [Agarivorans sp. TSD2052]UPW18785.1 hypothetical protein M0C34_00480 [Agarivorans sp. TSD2052]
MKKWTLTFLLAVDLLLITKVLASDFEGAKVIAYKFDPMEICTKDTSGAFTCEDKPVSELPDLGKQALFVKHHQLDPGLFAISIAGQDIWVFQDNVQIDKKARASVQCSEQQISQGDDTAVYASIGFGEGCK